MLGNKRWVNRWRVTQSGRGVILELAAEVATDQIEVAPKAELESSHELSVLTMLCLFVVLLDDSGTRETAVIAPSSSGAYG
ncbi:MAG TPA: hypothetical protein VH817_19685 [Thermoleophilaceae bacterium]